VFVDGKSTKIHKHHELLFMTGKYMPSYPTIHSTINIKIRKYPLLYYQERPQALGGDGYTDQIKLTDRHVLIYEVL